MQHYLKNNLFNIALVVLVAIGLSFGLIDTSNASFAGALLVGSTSPTITTAFKQVFHDTFIAALAQQDSRFGGAVTDRGTINGSSFTINNIGLVEMSEVTGRYQDKVVSDVDHATRIAYMADWDALVEVDTFDLAKLTADPTYKYVDLLKGAANRRQDAIIYNACLDAIAQRTEDGGTVTQATLPSSQIILAGGTGFTKAKLILVNSIFRRNECDVMNGEELYIAYNSKMTADIFSDTTLTSSDFLAQQMLQSGQVLKNWMGFTWIPYEALRNGAGGATEARTVAWAKSGVQKGMGIDVKVDVYENKSKRGNPTEAYCYMSMGAGRQDDRKVVAIDFLR